MIHGLTLVNKPPQLTSYAVVEQVKKIFKIKKVGHFGTLDPMAQGLLLIGMGHATKFFDFYTKKPKLYSGRIKFGYATSTYDREGEPTSEKKEIDLYQIALEPLLSGFIGKQMQVPPIYSAKKFKGQPMYKYARENREDEIELKAVAIEIFSLIGRVIDRQGLWFRTETSSGTYIRSLAHDMGQVVGVGAHLEELIREKVGEFSLEQAFTLEQLEMQVKAGEIASVVTPIEALLPEFPKIIVTAAGRQGVINGMPLAPGDVVRVITAQDTGNFRLFDDQGKLLAIARKDSKLMRFRPYIVFPG